MHFRAQPLSADGARQSTIVLFFWLVPAVALSAPTIPYDEPGRFVSRPYLRVASAPALRFAEPAPPPDLTVHPPAGAPPQPSPVTTEASAETKVETPTLSASVAPTAVVPAPPSATTVAPGATPAPANEPTKEKPVEAPPPEILPDDTRPKVRAEDFLPFFQFPGNNASDTLTAPQPGRQPPSSATYRQQ